jgi:uncharacterized protein
MPDKNGNIRIGVLSDTHGNANAVRLAMSRLKEMDHFIHLGDYSRDAELMRKLTRKPVEYVKGNCDMSSDAPDEKILTFGEVKILITHGHKYKVKYENTLLIYRAEEAGVNAVLFGHTHVPEIFCENNCVFFNPGSLAEPRSGIRPTYGTLLIRGKDIIPMTYTLD